MAKVIKMKRIHKEDSNVKNNSNVKNKSKIISNICENLIQLPKYD